MPAPRVPPEIGPEPFDGPVVQGLLAELPWGIGEIKRLFVREAGRRRGLARALLAAAEDAARALGYDELWLDTHADEPAALFTSAGWTAIPAYNDHAYARHWFARSLR